MNLDLIQRLRQRPDNERLWEAWYKATYPKVYYAAFRLAAGNPDVARDLTQETFTRFLEYRAIERVQSEQHAVAYLIKTCRNVASDRNVRAHQIPLESLVELDSIPASIQPLDPVVDLERAIHELTSDERTLVQSIRDGRSVQQIAEELGISYTAAGVRVHRLRKRLRKILG